jgi:dihydroorotate dehydrogenase
MGVGGIGTAADARERLDSGASLVQVYTGFVYRGPRLIREITSELAAPDSAEGA